MTNVLERPDTLFRYTSVDNDFLDRIKNYNPRTHIGDIIKQYSNYLPREAVLEILDALTGVVVVETECKQVVLHSQQMGQLHCLHDIKFGSQGQAWCHKCGEVYKLEDLGVVSRHVVTDAGVKNIVDVWNSAGTALNIWKYVGLGTGITAESAAQTALVTELTTEYASDNTRATGVISQPSNNVARVVDTNTLDSGTPAVTEAGLFSQAANSGGVLWDRFKFSAINLVGANGDGLQSTINSTFTSGG